MAALSEVIIERVAPKLHAISDDFIRDGKFVDPKKWRPKAAKTKVAYFGPHPHHIRMLRRGGANVTGLDFFAPGTGLPQ